MSIEAEYCESCGQKKIKSGLNVFDLFKDFITNIFNLDGRLFQSIKHLWQPAFLAKEYIGGKRKGYVNPIRFFLVMLVLIFFLLSHAMNNEAFDEGTMKAISSVEQLKLAQIYDSTVCVISPNLSVEEEQTLRDTVFGQRKKTSPRIFVGGNFLGWKIKEYEVTRHDAYSMDTDSLFVKYHLTNWYDQLFIKQLIKIDKNRSGSASYFISKLIWGVILFVFLIALFMKLLYVRSVFYYVEHLIVIILFGAKMLLVFNVIMAIQLLNLDLPLWNIFVFLVYLMMIVYLYLTLKKYYGQGALKTLVKSAILIVVSTYIFILSVTAVTLISMAFL